MYVMAYQHLTDYIEGVLPEYVDLKVEFAYDRIVEDTALNYPYYPPWTHS